MSCERYRALSTWEERKAEAQAIFEKHLGIGAQEPVNVDSYARQVTQDELGTASETLFIQVSRSDKTENSDTVMKWNACVKWVVCWKSGRIFLFEKEFDAQVYNTGWPEGFNLVYQ